MTKKINYSALQKIHKYHSVTPLQAAAGIVVGILVFGAAALIDKDWVGGVVLVLFLAAIGYAANSQISTDEKNDKKLAKFAKQNSFKFQAMNDSISQPGTLYSHGHTKYETRVISGEFTGLPMQLSDYHYTVGSGKSAINHTIRVMCLVLPRKLPHMVIDCLIDANGTKSALPIIFDKSQKIELEGDFYKYFALYVPDKYAVSALSIIAPDAMEALMKMEALCDIEIIEDRVYFYWPKADMQSYSKIFDTVQAVMGEIGRKLTRGDVFSTETQKRIHSEPSLDSATLTKGNFLERATSMNLLGFALLGYMILGLGSLLLSMAIKAVWIFEIGTYVAFVPVIAVLLVYALRRHTKHTLRKKLNHSNADKS